MDDSTREVRLAHWNTVVSECQNRPDGMTIKDWCSEHGISDKQYYYWQRQVRKVTYDQMVAERNLPAASSAGTITFAEVPLPQQNSETSAALNGFIPDAVLRAGKVTVALSNSASSQLICRIMEAVAYAE